MSEENWFIGLIKSLLGNPGASVTVPVTTTFAPPIAQRPFAIIHPSQNYRSAPGRVPTCIVIHATAGGFQGSLRELCDPKPEAPEKRVSAHYLIDKDGTVYRLVNEADIAWHAGSSFWQGKPNVNSFSIGIELVNANNGLDPYPEPQIAACAQLVRAQCEEYGIAPRDVVGHLDVAPGRKDDPRGLDLNAFRARLA